VKQRTKIIFLRPTKSVAGISNFRIVTSDLSELDKYPSHGKERHTMITSHAKETNEKNKLLTRLETRMYY